jgi:putative toxin-antitoxin system antitoxin component (TIGR02293 family)
MTKNIGKILGKGKINSRIDYIHLSREGITMNTFKRILEYTSLTVKEISQILPVSERQLSRYNKNHVLRKDISSHLIQLVELFERGFEVFGEENKFKIWIRSEIRALGNVKPIEILDTPIGIEMVKDILGRIEYGVYS